MWTSKRCYNRLKIYVGEIMSLDSFKNDDLDFGIKVENQEEMIDLSEYEKYNINELEEDIELSGRPFLMYFENGEMDERTYESIRLQLINDKDKELVNIYCNIPLGFPTIKNIRKSNNFYKNTFNFIIGVFNADKNLDETIFLDSNGKTMNTIKQINIESLMGYVNKKSEMKIKIVKNGDYNSFVILGLK